MTLLALLIGLVVERLATQLFHLRRLRWLDRLIDLVESIIDDPVQPAQAPQMKQLRRQPFNHQTN